jgi:hypothetical protein
MNFPVLRPRFAWVSAGFAALVITGAGVFLLSRTSVAPPRESVPSASRPLVRFAELGVQAGTGAWEVHSAMNDLTPLFLPSDRNARLPRLPLREPGDGTLDAETAKFRYREADAGVLSNFPPAATLNGKPLSQVSEIDGLHCGDQSNALAPGFGRRPSQVIPFPARGGLIEVFAAGTGQLIVREQIAYNSRPAWPQAWQPLEFLAAVETGGLVSPLSLTVASRVDAVDAFFRDYLARSFKVGERLAPGFYRVVVSP